MRAARSAVLLLALASCGYDPPPQTDVNSASYRTDRDACETAAATSVDKENAKRALVWLASPVRRWGQISDATQACMAGKGHGRLRWCTDDELKGGTRRGNVVVTASGVQCTDPPTKPAT